MSGEREPTDRRFSAPKFCSHRECLDRELRFLAEVDAVLWRQSGSRQRSYQAAARRFRAELAQQAVYREPRV